MPFALLSLFAAFTWTTLIAQICIAVFLVICVIGMSELIVDLIQKEGLKHSPSEEVVIAYMVFTIAVILLPWLCLAGFIWFTRFDRMYGRDSRLWHPNVIELIMTGVYGCVALGNLLLIFCITYTHALCHLYCEEERLRKDYLVCMDERNKRFYSFLAGRSRFGRSLEIIAQGHLFLMTVQFVFMHEEVRGSERSCEDKTIFIAQSISLRSPCDKLTSPARHFAPRPAHRSL